MLSAGSLLFHAGWGLLLAAMLAPRLKAARGFVALAAAAWLAQALFWTADPAGAAWSGAILLACTVLLARDLDRGRSVRFTDEEQAMVDSLVTGLSRSRARHLVDQGYWLNGSPGDVLTHEGEPVDNLYWLASGEAKAMSGGRQVGTCAAGDLIGEIAALSDEPATATVILDAPTRMWCAPVASLRPYVLADDEIKRAIERGFAEALKTKLKAANRTIAEKTTAAQN